MHYVLDEFVCKISSGVPAVTSFKNFTSQRTRHNASGNFTNKTSKNYKITKNSEDPKSIAGSLTFIVEERPTSLRISLQRQRRHRRWSLGSKSQQQQLYILRRLASAYSSAYCSTSFPGSSLFFLEVERVPWERGCLLLSIRDARGKCFGRKP